MSGCNYCPGGGGGGGGSSSGFRIRAEDNPFFSLLCTLLAGSGITLTQDTAAKTITIAAGDGSVNKIFLNENGSDSNLGNVETVIPNCEWNVNFDDAGANVQVRLSAFAKVTGGTGTYNLRVGGTKGAADGTVRATFTSSSLTFEQKTNQGAAFANPGGQQIVKLCLVNSDGGETTTSDGASISIG